MAMTDRLRTAPSRRFVSLAGPAILVMAALLTAPWVVHRHDHAISESVSGEQAGSRHATAGIKARIVSDEALPGVPGMRVIVELVDFPPGASVAEHHHGGAVTAYIMEGTIRSGLNGEPPLDYGPEQTFFEPDGTVHTVTMNPSSTQPARFLAIHVLKEGAPLTTYH